MKPIYFTLFIAALLCSCTTESEERETTTDNSSELFEANSKTVMTYLNSYQNENIDYAALYSDSFLMRGTWQGAGDSVTLEELMEYDAKAWEQFDYKIVTDPIVLLPGVNVDTKKPDGSVRYYATWKVTKTATDSTEAKSAMLKLYESFDFDENGKIAFQQYYGDFGGLRKALKN